MILNNGITRCSLAMINTVPILQTAGERKDLELRCRGRCDIIFSYQRTLGTYGERGLALGIQVAVLAFDF